MNNLNYRLREAVLKQKCFEANVIIPEDVKVELYEDFALRQLVMSLSARIASLKVENYEFRAPKDWFEALKERFFPKWVLKKFPVKYRVEKINVEALFPKIKMDKEYQSVFIFEKLNENQDNI